MKQHAFFKLHHFLMILIMLMGQEYSSYGDVQPPEVRFGGMYYRPRQGSINFKTTPEISIQYLFSSLGTDNTAVSTNPRPHLGCVLNLNGGTSQYYAGLTWHIPVDNLFVEFGLGGEVHNGPLTKGKTGDKRRILGSRMLFRESAAVGMNLGEAATLSLILDHASNADLVLPNGGLTGIGLQIGYKF